MQRNVEPRRRQLEWWQRSELTDVTAKVVIYEAFVDGKLEAPKHLSWSWIPFRNSRLRQSWTRIWKLCLSGAHPQHRAMRTRYDLIRRG